MTEALAWGAVDLLPTDEVTAELGYMIEASSDGTHWGNPQAVVTAIQSRLQDGSMATVDSYENREAPMFLRVTSDTFAGLEAAEAALVAESQREGFNTLTWCPSVEFAAPSVFDVVYGILAFNFDDLTDVDMERYFVATLTCLPFPRSATEVVATAEPPPPAVETSANVADGTSTGGWSAGWTHGADSGSVAVSTSSGHLAASAPSMGGYATVYMTDANPVPDVDDMPYVRVDWRSSGGTVVAATAAALVPGADEPGTMLEKIADVASPVAGYTRSYFRVPPGATDLSVFRMAVATTTGGTFSPRTLLIDNIDVTDQLPTIGSKRQTLRTIPVQGTMRTQGQLSIQHSTKALGEVLAYVYKNTSSGYSPALRPFYVSGGGLSSADTTLVSGASNMLDTPVEYRVPATRLVRGGHRLYARVKGNSAGTVTLTIAANTLIGTTPVDGGELAAAAVDVTTNYTIVDLGPLSLPPTLVSQNSDAVVAITIADADTTGIDVTLDEAWVFNLDIGALTHVDCGTAAPSAGGSARRLWMDPATVTNDGEDMIFVGHSADRSDAFHPATDIKGWTPPIFEAGSTCVFVVTANTDSTPAAVELRHFPRGLHHAPTVAA